MDELKEKSNRINQAYDCIKGNTMSESVMLKEIQKFKKPSRRDQDNESKLKRKESVSSVIKSYI